MLRRIFGGTSNKKEEQSSSIRESLQKVKECEEMLIKRQDFLERKIQNEVNIAKSRRKDNRRIALHALRKKKRYEMELQRMDVVLTKLNLQRLSLENTIMYISILEVLKDSCTALKNINESMDVSRIYDVIDEGDELNLISNDINMVLSRPVKTENEIDDEELLRELGVLENEKLSDNLRCTTTNNNNNINGKLPFVPSHDVPSKKDDKNKRSRDVEDELDDLRAWAAS
uniref:GH13992p (inferred by orthology to a D. melanogaster protein) n=1 Tax=Strongyloides venezuelensis TaxID=75913 RepID=A0A0K0G369_STRVS